MLAIWSLVPLPFLNPAWTSGSSLFTLLKPGLENFEHYFASVWDECNFDVVWTYLALHFFGIGMKTDLFQSCGHCWVFQICWHIECSTFTASSFTAMWLEGWNSQSQLQDPKGRRPCPLHRPLPPWRLNQSPMCLVTQSCLTLCIPVDCSPPGSSVHGYSSGKNTEWVAMPSSRDSPTQESNPGLPHHRRILCCLSHQPLI